MILFNLSEIGAGVAEIAAGHVSRSGCEKVIIN